MLTLTEIEKSKLEGIYGAYKGAPWVSENIFRTYLNSIDFPGSALIPEVAMDCANKIVNTINLTIKDSLKPLPADGNKLLELATFFYVCAYTRQKLKGYQPGWEEAISYGFYQFLLKNGFSENLARNYQRLISENENFRKCTEEYRDLDETIKRIKKIQTYENLIRRTYPINNRNNGNLSYCATFEDKAMAAECFYFLNDIPGNGIELISDQASSKIEINAASMNLIMQNYKNLAVKQNREPRFIFKVVRTYAEEARTGGQNGNGNGNGNGNIETSDDDFRGFLRTIIEYERRPLRWRRKQIFTVTADGVYERPYLKSKLSEHLTLKKPQYSITQKQHFSQPQSTSLATPGRMAPFYTGSYEERRLKAVGIKLSTKDVLTQRILRYDRGTVTRPFDYCKPPLYAGDGRKIQGLYKNIGDLEKDPSESLNEVMARCRWNCDGTSEICIFSDTKESRFLAQDRARQLKRRLPIQDDNYHVPIVFYLETNKEEGQLTSYSLDQQFDDRESAYKLYNNPTEREQAYKDGNFEFLLVLDSLNPVEILLKDELVVRLLDSGRVHIVQSLLEKATPEQLQKFNNYKPKKITKSPLAIFYAAKAGDVRLVEWLIRKKFPIAYQPRFWEVKDKDYYQYNPLLAAVKEKHSDVVRVLLKHFAIFKNNKYGYTFKAGDYGLKARSYLHWAIENGDEETLTLLLETKGMEQYLNWKGIEGDAPLQLAALYAERTSNEAKQNSNDNVLYAEAKQKASARYWRMVLAILKRTTVNNKHKFYQSLLYKAIENNQIEIANFLLDAGVKPISYNQQLSLAPELKTSGQHLKVAFQQNNPEVVDLLLEKNKYLALEKGDKDKFTISWVASKLLNLKNQKEQQKEAVTNLGNAILKVIKKINLIVEKEPFYLRRTEIESIGKAYEKILQFAVRHNRRDIIQALFQGHAISEKMISGIPQFVYLKDAIDHNNIEVFELLIKGGLNPALVGDHNNGLKGNIVQYAGSLNRWEYIKVIAKHCKITKHNHSKKDSYQYGTVLAFAINSDNPPENIQEFTEMLLKAGADINSSLSCSEITDINLRFQNCLQLAVKKENYPVVSLLLKLGADPCRIYQYHHALRSEGKENYSAFIKMVNKASKKTKANDPHAKEAWAIVDLMVNKIRQNLSSNYARDYQEYCIRECNKAVLYAVEAGNLEAVKALLKIPGLWMFEFEINHKDCIEIAIKKKQPAMLELLLKHCPRQRLLHHPEKKAYFDVAREQGDIFVANVLSQYMPRSKKEITNISDNTFAFFKNELQEKNKERKKIESTIKGNVKKAKKEKDGFHRNSGPRV